MPLAQLLAPQITQKLNQIEVDLGRQGYLAHSALASDGNVADRAPQSPNTSGKLPAGYNRLGDEKIERIRKETEAQAKKFDPRGALGRPKMPELADPDASGAVMRDARRALGNVSPAATRGFDRGAVGKKPQLLPNAPATPQPQARGRGFLGAAPGQPIGYTESGIPIMAPQQPQTGRVVLSAADLNSPGAMVNERGQAVNKKGKKTGYLAPQDPNVHMRLPDQMNPYETGGAKLLGKFPGNEGMLMRRYDEHKRALDENNGALPPGYFKALGKERGRAYSAAEQEDIYNGIEELRKIDKGVST